MNMSRVIFFLFGILGVINFNYAQTYTSANDSDPKAKKILDDLKRNYDSYKSLYIEFELILDLPQADKEVQNGYIKQQGEKFAAEIDGQEIYCNGSYISVFLKDNNEVQINDYDPDDTEGMMTPKDLLQIYENGDYAYAITGTERIDGKSLKTIEFKPLDPNSEYSKLRLYADQNKREAYRIQVFSKNGSRYTLTVKKLEPNKKFVDSDFEFDASKHPNLYIEDLRID